MLPLADLGLLPESAAGRHGGTALCADTPWPSAGLRDPETVADFAAVVADHADRLWAAGVRPGTVVALVKANHLDIQALLCALVRVGALPAPLSVAMDPDDLLSCLKELEQPWLLTDAAGAEALRPRYDRLDGIVPRVLTLTPGAAPSGAAPTGEAPPGVAPPGAVELGETAPHRVTRRPGTDPVLVTHSSGTTGKPKLLVHTVDSLHAHVAPQIGVVRSQHYAGLSAKCLSFVHVRMATALLTALHTGVPLLAVTSSDPDAVRAALLRYRPETLEAQPNTFLRWEALARETPSPFASVRRYVSTFDALHPRTLRALLDASDDPDPAFVLVYGQTETGPVTLLTATRSDLRTPGRLDSRDVGAALPGTEIRVVDDAGSDLPADEPGHVEVRTPARAERMIGRPPLPGRDTWWPTGDIGSLGPDGHLKLLDRRADRVPGVPSALRAEDVLLDELPELDEVVVTAAEGGTVTVVAATADGAPPDAERWRAARRRAGLPDDTRLDCRPWQGLPLTGTMKVRRHRLTADGALG
ncbi:MULTISPECIES: AMP-binding protein [Streptomyces]|uniref:AMP-binding protein n=1 Tax=Streptomyces TaxID=1883 RepID=UPI00163C2296|nr:MULTISPECIES: class I adenylate-forming enzyme family protein [Streptomyces]MBC2877567.1 acyl--CoA ligase [Streptomyces sp. TYQ1024]UBI36195.1 acyl--CoA ligase [Streptomyces mobaraensis]UKW28788.1 acyl--CoA ligase [Streptomyces sp. TYQ1024]